MYEKIATRCVRADLDAMSFFALASSATEP